MLDLGASASVIENAPCGRDTFGGDPARSAGRPEQASPTPHVPRKRTDSGLVVRHGRVFPMAWPARNRFGA